MNILQEESPLARLACVMVGLPARVGNYRREAVGAEQKSEFFDPTNKEFSLQRSLCAEKALDDMLEWLTMGRNDNPSSSVDSEIPVHRTPSIERPNSLKKLSRSNTGAGVGGPSRIGLYDATNSTKERRKMIVDKCVKAGIKIFFVENICNDEDLIMNNIKEVKLSSPDYVGWEAQAAIADFQRRIDHYASSYETISEDEMEGAISFVKIFNIGKQVTANNVQGYLESRIVYFLMNLNTVPRSFYISRHGESAYNLEGKIGGDSELSPQGLKFASKLPDVIKENIKHSSNLIIWTSTLKRTIQTASYLDYPKLQWKQLDELNSGLCDGLTYEQIEEKYPLDYIERDLDKFNYRYHGGESYRDLVHRLEPVILELERHKDPLEPIYIIGHQAVVRAIYAYFHGISHSELPYIKIPLHTLIKLTPKAYNCLEERIAVDVPAVDTHRPKQNPVQNEGRTNLKVKPNAVIQRMPRSQPNVSRIVLVKNFTIFWTFLMLTCVSIVLLQVLSLLIFPVKYPLQLLQYSERKKIDIWFYQQYKTVVRITEKAFGSTLVLLCYLAAPKTKLVLTGEHKSLEHIEKTILISNHQIYLDWLYLWILARRYQRHADIKIMLIAILQYAPIFGWGMTFFDFIFMKQKLALDRQTIMNCMERQRTYCKGLPLWLILFPEGTLNTPNNRVTSRAYAKKNDMPEDPKYVILPKSTGLFMCADALGDQIEYIIDISMGYSGLDREDIPYEEYLPENVFWKQKYPDSVHIHVEKYKLKELPGFNEKLDDAGYKPDQKFLDAFNEPLDKRRSQFSTWVRKLFMEKDEIIRNFYDEGKLSDSETLVWEIKPDLNDWVLVIASWLSMVYTIPLLISVLSFGFKILK